MNLYATLTELRRYLGLSSAQTGDDDLLLLFLDGASRLIEAYAGRQFYPLRKTRYYICSDPALLLLGGDLLALHGLTNGDGSTMNLSAVHLEPAGCSVQSSILLDRTQAAFIHNGDPVDAIAVDGTWGYHSDWTTAWAASGDSVSDNPLSSGANTITVTDVDGPDVTGLGIRFAVGQLLQIEDEYLHVLAIDTALNRLTVARGVNGTTAASHTQGTFINVYQPPEGIRQVCLRVAAWLYKQKDAGFIQAANSLRSQIAVPPALPDDVQSILAPYSRLVVA